MLMPVRDHRLVGRNRASQHVWPQGTSGRRGLPVVVVVAVLEGGTQAGGGGGGGGDGIMGMVRIGRLWE